MSAAESEHPERTGEDEVSAWRLNQMLATGVDWSLASHYADEVDPHDVEALVRKGCPPDLAVHLLRP